MIRGHFQIWACKQMMGIVGTFKYWSRYKSDTDPMYSSCMVEEKTCRHILHCQEEGLVKAIHASLKLLEDWLEEMDIDPMLVGGIMTFARGQGEESMANYYLGYPQEYKPLGFGKIGLA